MKTRKRILSIVLTIAILLLLVLDIPVTAAGTKKVDVLFTHDTHSHLDSFSTIVDGQQKEVGGFAKIKTLMDEKKKDNPSRTACVGRHLHGGATKRQQAGAQAHPRSDGGADPTHQRQHGAAQTGNADGNQL